MTLKKRLVQLYLMHFDLNKLFLIFIYIYNWLWLKRFLFVIHHHWECWNSSYFQSYTVAVMVPIRNALEKLAQELGKTYSDYNILCQDNDIVQVFLNNINIHIINNISCSRLSWKVSASMASNPISRSLRSPGWWLSCPRPGPRSQVWSPRHSRSRGRSSRPSSSRTLTRCTRAWSSISNTVL